MTTALQLQAIASNSSMRLIDSLVQGLVACLFAALLFRLSRHKSAGTRFAIGFWALVAIALLPLTRVFWPQAQPSLTAPAIVIPESWALYLFVAWAVIATLLLARVARSVLHLHKLRRGCVPVEASSLDPLVAESLKRKQTWRNVRLCTSEQVRVPTALGIMKPAIVIPLWVMRDLSAAELNQVVLHELAHLRRYDDWTNLAQQVVKAMFFFHPAVWWIERKISLEREMACDDAVLAETESPRAYAECLAHLAERSFVQRGIALAQALVGQVTQISQRVAQILDVNRPKGNSRVCRPAVSAMIVVGMLCSVWVARTPELVGFESNKPGAVEFSHSLQERVGVPVTNAALVQRSAPEQLKIRAIPARRNQPIARKLHVRGPQLATRTQNSSSLVHLSSLKPNSLPVSETLLVFIERAERGSGQAQVYRLEMWQVIILPTADAVGSKTPSKKT